VLPTLYTDRGGNGGFANACACSLDGTSLFAANSFGQVFYSRDSGATFNQTQIGVNYQFQCIACSSNGNIVIVGEKNSSGGRVFISTNGASSFSQVTTFPSFSATPNWWSLCCSDNGTSITVSDYFGGYTYTSTNTGSTWTKSSVARTLYRVACNSDGTIVVGIQNPGYIHRSTNSGYTWTQLTSDASRYWWPISSSSDGSVLVAAAQNMDYIYLSKNSGATWTAITSAGTSGGWTAAAMSSNGNRIVVNDRSGYLWLSTNGGTTWTSFGTSNSGVYGMSCDSKCRLLFGTKFNYKFFTYTLMNIKAIGYTALYNSATVDLTKIFDNTNPGNQTTGFLTSATGYTASTDLGKIFTPYANGTKITVGYKTGAGTDLGELFQLI